MKTTEEGPSPDEFAGCRLFMSPSGKAGLALGNQGNRRGGLYNFFVSPIEQGGAASRFMALAVHEGATNFICYDHPVLPRFFAQFGFIEASRVLFTTMNPPLEWSHKGDGLKLYPNGYPDVLFMFRAIPQAPAAAAANSLVERLRPRGPATSPVNDGSCAACGARASTHTVNLGELAGYECPDCGFIDAWGLLALGPRKPFQGG